MAKAQFSEFCSRLRETYLTGDGSWGADDSVFLPLALELFRLQFAANDAYRRLCEARGVAPENVTHWREVPFVSTRAFKEYGFSVLSLSERVREFRSSGTTQERPSRHFHNGESLELYEDFLWPWFQRHCVPEPVGLRFVSLTPGSEQAPYSSLVHMFVTIRRRLADGVFLGEANDAGWGLDGFRVMEELKVAAGTGTPVLLAGTAFNFVQLLDGLAGRRLKLSEGSRVLETGGYKGRTREVLKPELYEAIAEALGVPEGSIVSEYGMSELSSQGYDGVVGGVSSERCFRFPPWARAEVISPDRGIPAMPGETGVVRVFDLANAFSVAAIETEDLAVARPDGFCLLGRVSEAPLKGCSLFTAETGH